MAENNSEGFRNELIAKLSEHMTADQIKEVLCDFDATSVSYDIIRKSTDIITVDGIPEAVKAFIAAKSIVNLSMNTLKQYTYRLTDFFGKEHKAFSDITATDIRMYLHEIKISRNVSDVYIDDIRRILNSFFQWLVNNDYLLRNPCAKVEPTKYQPKEREPFSAYDLEVIRYYCRDFREKSIVDFLFSTGCRVYECSEVKLSDIDWHERSVIIRHGKGNKRRTVFFNAESEFSLRKYLESRTDDCEYLFVTARGIRKKLEIRSIQALVRNIGKRCAMHAYPHRFRHTFATHGIRSGVPVTQLQLLMGHEKPETTMIYAKIDMIDVQRSHQRAYA